MEKLKTVNQILSLLSGNDVEKMTAHQIALIQLIRDTCDNKLDEATDMLSKYVNPWHDHIKASTLNVLNMRDIMQCFEQDNCNLEELKLGYDYDKTHCEIVIKYLYQNNTHIAFYMYITHYYTKKVYYNWKTGRSIQEEDFDKFHDSIFKKVDLLSANDKISSSENK